MKYRGPEIPGRRSIQLLAIIFAIGVAGEKIILDANAGLAERVID